MLIYSIESVNTTCLRAVAYDEPKVGTDLRTGLPLDSGLRGNEMGAAKMNDGFFERVLLSVIENNHMARGNAFEVKFVGNGYSFWIRTVCTRILTDRLVH